jgi:hypothetical protein
MLVRSEAENAKGEEGKTDCCLKHTLATVPVPATLDCIAPKCLQIKPAHGFRSQGSPEAATWAPTWTILYGLNGGISPTLVGISALTSKDRYGRVRPPQKRAEREKVFNSDQIARLETGIKGMLV